MNQLVGASCGAAGQRCMAISVAVFVGASKEGVRGLRTERGVCVCFLGDPQNVFFGVSFEATKKGGPFFLRGHGFD